MKRNIPCAETSSSLALPQYGSQCWAYAPVLHTTLPFRPSTRLQALMVKAQPSTSIHAELLLISRTTFVFSHFPFPWMILLQQLAYLHCPNNPGCPFRPWVASSKGQRSGSGWPFTPLSCPHKHSSSPEHPSRFLPTLTVPLAFFTKCLITARRPPGTEQSVPPPPRCLFTPLGLPKGPTNGTHHPSRENQAGQQRRRLTHQAVRLLPWKW